MHTDIKIKAGVIEGFFGKPWDWSARLSGASFLRDCGYKFFIYAPKSESFLRRAWHEPFPEQSLEHLRELGGRCRQSSVAFGIGLTPFEIYLNYDKNAQVLLRSKVLQINEVGADILCILFDDMRGDVEGLPDLQARVISDVCGWSNAESFIVCPTYYSYDSRLIREFRPSAQNLFARSGQNHRSPYRFLLDRGESHFRRLFCPASGKRRRRHRAQALHLG
jgi:hyaluronoglucosaminidase